MPFKLDIKSLLVFQPLSMPPNKNNKDKNWFPEKIMGESSK